jgi:branched-chain amino acid transport system substrate-binding protein
MRKRHVLWLLGIAVALLTMVAVACGGGEEEEATPMAETPSAETPMAETPMAEETPAVPQEVPGVTDDEIIFGTHQPLSGPVAAYSQIAKATKAYFDYINDTEGGVYGRKITYLIEDDQYSPPLTVDAVRRLVEQDNVFAILNGLGTATHMQVVDYLRDRDIPDLFPSTGALEWVRDPAARPNCFGILPNYVAEGILYGKYIVDNYPGAKVGVVGQNDDFGFDAYDGLERGIGDANEILPMETFEFTDPDVNSQIDRLQAAGAEVLVVFATPAQAPAAVRHTRADLGWDVPILIDFVSANEIVIALAGAENMEGVITAVALHQIYETDLPAVQKHIEVMADYGGLTNPGYLTEYGQSVGETIVNALEEAGPDLTRQGLIDTLESAPPFQCSVCLFAGGFSPTDHDAQQSLMFARVELAPEDPIGARYVPFGDAYTWEGHNPDDMTADDITTIPSPYQ